MDFLNKWVERRRPLRLTQALGARLLLGIEDLVEAVALAQLRHVINDAQVALNHVNQQVCQRDEVIAPARRLEVHGVDAAEGNISFEGVH